MECLAIGSLPYKDPQKAMDTVQKYFRNIPFWPQLSKVSKNEDMTNQFLEGMPSFFVSEDENFSFDTENEKFFQEIETFLSDYENIITGNKPELLQKFAITDKFSSTFGLFLEFIKQNNCKFAKGQIVGPFTLATILTDKKGRCAIYDDTLKELIVKILSLKALWQVKQIKLQGATPIIFIDEPSLSQIGTSSYITITKDDASMMLKEIVDIIKNNGGIASVHCCGKCNWSIPIKVNIDMISLDAYHYAQNLSLYWEQIEAFLTQGGKIAWGIVPTKSPSLLEKTDLQTMQAKFDKAVNYLTKKGIDEKLVIDNSFVTPTCGAGSLSEILAEKAMRLTYELSNSLKERYNDN